MSIENPGIFFDASCSWNGYNHQGKLAIWYALKKITELYDCSKSEMDNLHVLGKFFLEIEYLEDFSLGKYLESGDTEYLFVHQVKNHEKTNASEYDSALLGLACHISDRPCIQTAYLHTTKKIDFGEQTLLDYVRTLVSNPINLQKILDNITAVKSNKEELDKIVTPKRGRPSNFKQRLTEAYAESIGEDYVKIDKSNVDAALVALETKIQKQITVSKSMTDDQLMKIKEYPYEINGVNQSYCGVEQIESLLKQQIKAMASVLPTAKSYWSTKDYVERRYLYLLGKLDQHIVERNLNFPLYKSGKKERKIALKEIYQWIIDPIIDELPDEFFLYYIKETFFKIIDQYCSSNRCKRKESCSECAVHTCVNKIGCMSFDEMKSFLCLTNPTVSDKMSMTTYSQYTGKNGLINPFIRGLSTISMNFEGNKTAITYKDRNTFSHVLTTILSDDDGNDAPDICLDILKNRDLYELMMECDCFISRDLEVSSIQAEGLKCGYIYEEKDKDHIARFKNVQIEKLSDFITQLSAED